MTAVAVEYRPAMDSCVVGMRLYKTCALTAPDSSDPGEYPEEYGKYRKCEGKELLYNLGVANVLVL